MIVDTSAVVAILREEPAAPHLVHEIADAETVGIGSPTLTEAGLVMLGRVGVRGRTLLHRFVQEADIDVVSFRAEHWSVAMDAFSRFGKGRHPAALNFGDCLAYATSYIAGEPLLCTGDDFSQTDLPLVQ